MEEKSFIIDETNSHDEEKLLYHFFCDEMRNFRKRFNWFITFLILSIAMTIVGYILITSNFYHQETGKVLLVTGVVGFLIFTLLIITNKVTTSINKLDLVYLPISQMKFQNGSILVDRSGIISATEFNFANLNDDDIRLVDSLYKSLVMQTNEMPYVLSEGKHLNLKNTDSEYAKENIKMYSEEVNYIDINNSLEDVFGKIKNYNIELRAYKYSNDFIKALAQNSSNNPKNKLEEHKESDIIKGLNQINGIISLYMNEKEALIDIDDLCQKILELQERTIPRMDYTIHSSLNHIVFPSTFKFTNVIEKASYNYFCPGCNSDLLKRLEIFDYSHDGKTENRIFFPINTKMEIVDIKTNIWRCPLCNIETDQPYPRHKFEDELFTPVYDKLYEENYMERLKIYNHINDEKRKYTEKAEELFHQVMRESRTKVDNIKSKIRTIQSEVSADEMAVRDLNKLLLKYKKIADNKAKQIESDLDNHKKAIEAENKKSRERIDKTVDAAKKNIEESTKRYARLEREDQAKRDAVQREIAENAEATKNILHAIARKSGAIEDKGTVEQIWDDFMGNKPDKGLEEGEKWG